MVSHVQSGRRLQKELVKVHHGLPPGITFVSLINENVYEWLMDIRVLDDNPLYKDQFFRLQFSFPSAYPIHPPEVVFLKDKDHPIPMHPHVYSNGVICLNVLGLEDWSPVQSVESLCLSLQSMLTDNTKNERPENDDEFSTAQEQQNATPVKDIPFRYDDDEV